MDHFVYIIKCCDRSTERTYVGWTTDLERRIKTHNAGKGAKSTRGRTWALVYAEKYPTRTEAMRREWSLKKDRAFRNHLKHTRP
ncbi:MAG: GIY-YIG nuclease family protein [Rhodospirillales bacterium]